VVYNLVRVTRFANHFRSLLGHYRRVEMKLVLDEEEYKALKEALDRK